MAHSYVDANDLELQHGTMRRVRAELGVRTFGINQFELAPNQSGYEHDESESNQDEVYVILAGSGRMTVGGDEVELKPGRYVHVTAEETRNLHSGSEGLTWIAVGAPQETPYHPKGFF